MKENAAEPAHPPREETLAEVNRRRFLEKLSIGLGALCAAILGLPVVGFLLAPLFRRAPGEWRSVGSVSQFEIGKTVVVSFIDASPLPWAGVTAKTAAWLRRVNDTEFIAFAVNCTHLGCPVRWLQDARLFMCPCHGGVYYEDGSVAAGPPPKPLTRYRLRVVNGDVQIQAAPIPITT
ncbi:MAG: Rieske (2Fe-2S) protein [Chthoniobacter sp.]|uniref:QcrA and Rieske domain-containing protein n=1 Tax=Chthoniobacter sp. TaxID=2510640 RepID=UPI0032AE27CC